MHTRRAHHRTGGIGLAGVDTGTQRGHDHVDVAQTDRGAGSQPGQCGRFSGEGMRGFDAVDDVRQQVAAVLQPGAAMTLSS